MNKNNIHKIKRTNSLQNTLYGAVRKLIIEGKIEPGERINIEAISKMLGVSRTPLREVLQRFQSEGLVRFVPSTGPIVEELSLKEIEEAYAIRLSLEQLAIKEAMKNINTKDFERLGKTITDTCEMIESENYKKIVELNEKFHFHLYRLANNDLLEKFMREIFTRIERCTNLLSRLDQFVVFATADHKAIVDSLKRNDIMAAQEAITRHLTKSFENLKRMLSKKLLDQGKTAI